MSAYSTVIHPGYATEMLVSVTFASRNGVCVAEMYVPSIGRTEVLMYNSGEWLVSGGLKQSLGLPLSVFKQAVSTCFEKYLRDITLEDDSE